LSKQTLKSNIIQSKDVPQTDLETFCLEIFQTKGADMTPKIRVPAKIPFVPMGNGQTGKLDPGQSLEEAKKILAEAKEKYQAIIARARNEAIKIEQEAFNQGLEEGKTRGREEGRWEGRGQFEAEVLKTYDILKAIENLYQDLHSANEVTLVKLAQTIAERVILSEAELSSEMIAGAVKAALEKLHDMHEAVLRVHPDDLKNIQSLPQKIKDQANASIKVVFEPDSSLARGDLIVETQSGRIDATLQKRLQAVCAVVDEELTRGREIKDRAAVPSESLEAE